MEFTVYFLRVFVLDLLYAGPILLCLILTIGLIGYRIGKIEGWSLADALYHAFINATTVGYGDLRPSRKTSKALAIVLVFVGLVFTGMFVAIAVHAADYAYGQVYEMNAFRRFGGGQDVDTPTRDPLPTNNAPGLERLVAERPSASLEKRASGRNRAAVDPGR